MLTWDVAFAKKDDGNMRNSLKNECRREKDEQWRKDREIFIRTMPFLRGLGARAWHRVVVVERRGPVTDIPLSPDPSYDPPSTGSHGDIAIVHAPATEDREQPEPADSSPWISAWMKKPLENASWVISFPISKRIKHFPCKYTIISQLTMSI